MMAGNNLDNSQDHAADFNAFLAAEVYRSQVWLLFVIGLPFIILVALSGWGDTFQSGDASAFICGAIIASLSENIIERVKAGNLKLQTASFVTVAAAVYAAGFLIWNGLFAVADKAFQHSSVDWVQVVAFFVTVFSLPLIRGFASKAPAKSLIMR